MNFVLKELYESVLITEMTQKVVDYLEQHTDQLPFDHIFGEKLRVAFPIGTDVTAQSIIDDLKRIQHFDKVDLKSGEVIRKIKIDPKYGQGDHKEQKINMGKAINSLKIPDDKKKSYLDWFARYKDNLESAFEKPEYIVILSRAPIDVVRMSDHRNIQSCHSKGGSYFKCAIQEAISGGAVAYVVKEEDFAELSEEEFQNDEIFMDSDRGISGTYGLRPKARLRVRRLEGNGGVEIAIPDTKVYGDTTIPNFYESLKSYLQRKQSVTPDDFKVKGAFSKRGGTYYDDGIRELVASYFNDDTNTYDDDDFPKIHHDSDDNDSENAHAIMGMEEELDNIKERYNPQMTYSSADYYLYDDDPYFSISGGSSFDISRFNLPSDIDWEVEDSYEIRKAERGEQDDDYTYSALVEYLKNSSNLDIYKIAINSESLNISFQDEETHNDPDKFDTFCYYLKQFDDKIDDRLEDEDELLQAFMDSGFIKEKPEGDPNFSTIVEYMNSEEEWFDYFTLSGNRISKPYTINGIDIILLNSIGQDYIWSHIKNLRGITSFIIARMAEDLFKPTPDKDDEAQLQFNKFFEAYINNMEGIDYTVEDVSALLNHSGQFVMTIFKVKFPTMDNKNFEFVRFIDDMFVHIMNALRLHCILSLKEDVDYEAFTMLSKKHNLPQLEKIYSKYIK
jgi:hypothetical protein